MIKNWMPVRRGMAKPKMNRFVEVKYQTGKLYADYARVFYWYPLDHRYDITHWRYVSDSEKAYFELKKL